MVNRQNSQILGSEKHKNHLCLKGLEDSSLKGIFCTKTNLTTRNVSFLSMMKCVIK